MLITNAHVTYTNHKIRRKKKKNKIQNKIATYSVAFSGDLASPPPKIIFFRPTRSAVTYGFDKFRHLLYTDAKIFYPFLCCPLIAIKLWR